MAEPSALDAAARAYGGRDRPTLLANLVAIALPDASFKNIFMLPGGRTRAGPGARSLPRRGREPAAGAGQHLPDRLRHYTINRWLDGEFDRHHPVKKFRPSAAGQITAPVAYALRELGRSGGQITPSRSRVSLCLPTPSSIGTVIKLLAKLWAER
jgi:hypothetical protein